MFVTNKAPRVASKGEQSDISSDALQSVNRPAVKRERPKRFSGKSLVNVHTHVHVAISVYMYIRIFNTAFLSCVAGNGSDLAGAMLSRPVTRRQNPVGAATLPRGRSRWISAPTSPRHVVSDVKDAQQQQSTSPEFELFLLQLRNGKSYRSAASSPQWAAGLQRLRTASSPQPTSARTYYVLSHAPI